MTIRRPSHCSINEFLYILLFFFTIDGVFHLTRFIPWVVFGIREFIFLLMVGLSIPLMIHNKYWISNKYSLLVMLMLFFVTISICRALLLKQNLEFIIDTIYEYIYFLYYIFFIFAISCDTELKSFVKLITILGCILSFLSIYIEFCNLVDPRLCVPIVELSSKMQFLQIYNPFGKVTRIMWSGIVVQIVAFYICISNYIDSNRTKFLFLLLLNAMGIFLTYSRGIIAGVIVGLFVYVLLIPYNATRKYSSRMWKLAVIGVVGLIIVIGVVLSLKPEIITVFFERLNQKEVSTSSSDSLRNTMTVMLNELIAKKPIFGSGAGAHINFRDGRVEMTYHSIVSKMGFIGIFVFILPYINIIHDYRKKFRKDSLIMVRAALISALSAVMVATYSNPYLLGSIGLLLYCLCMRLCLTGKKSIHIDNSVNNYLTIF